MSNENLIARARDYAETLRKRWGGRDIEINLLRDLANALEVSEAVTLALVENKVRQKICPNGFINLDFLTARAESD